MKQNNSAKVFKSDYLRLAKYLYYLILRMTAFNDLETVMNYFSNTEVKYSQK